MGSKTGSVAVLLGLLTVNTLVPSVRNFPQQEKSSLLSSAEKIIDGAGYSMHNTAFSLDLAAQANSPVDGEQLGSVTMEPYQNGRDQKWGTSFYGTNQVALSNGLVGKNVLSVYLPEGSSRDRARLYAFENLSNPNIYKILNLETNLCLVANQRSSNEPITVEFGSCTEGNYSWLLRRTG
ncbi:unnamed protein product [Orchesella dallaii]|uniref:Uncharacterized protein n=1 Tax=Orchesella dallaii TaxID=48710 RepID=A0ABP1QYN5_9HEXA